MSSVSALSYCSSCDISDYVSDRFSIVVCILFFRCDVRSASSDSSLLAKLCMYHCSCLTSVTVIALYNLIVNPKMS